VRHPVGVEDSALFRAMQAWADATVDVLKTGTRLSTGPISDEVWDCEVGRAWAGAQGDLIRAITAQREEIAAHAVSATRALAELLDSVADEIEEGAP